MARNSNPETLLSLTSSTQTAPPRSERGRSAGNGVADFLVFAPVWAIMKSLGMLPRPVARLLGIAFGRLVGLCHPNFRRVGMRNLALAFPELPEREHRRLLRLEFDNLGRLLAEFCLFPRYRRENVKEFVDRKGFENYQQAHAAGQGVILLTAHMGGWEIGSFVQSLLGHPMLVVVRKLDNFYLNRLVERYRSLHGNKTFDKQDFVRGLLGALRAGETVGLLMDTNITPPQGIFVPFFGVPACTANGIARVAGRTGAAVVPAFTVWEDTLGKYRIHFAPAVDMVRTGDEEADAVTNTARFTLVLENFIRRYPGQWLWVHRRWKSRPPGEAPLY